MDDSWQILTRVRAMRVRLALNELLQRRQAEARAQTGLQRALRVQAQFEEQALQVSASLVSRLREDDDTAFGVERAQQLLSYVAGARRKALEAATPVRRAKMQCERTEAAAAQARASYWHEARRHDTVHSKWRREASIEQRSQLEREDETLVAERVAADVALGRADERE